MPRKSTAKALTPKQMHAHVQSLVDDDAVEPVKFHAGLRLTELRPYERNPRVNDDVIEVVKRSLQQMGPVAPIVADENARICCGHTRYKAALDLGLQYFPVLICRFKDEATFVAYNIADNQTAGIAEWDYPGLGTLIKELEADDFPTEVLGFSAPELDEIYRGLEGDSEAVGDPEAVPDVPEKPITKPGDVWVCGDHRLLCGDCTTEKVDIGAAMLLTDPPYGVAYVGKTKDALTIKGDDLSKQQLTEVVTKWFDSAESACKPGAYWFATVPAGPLHVVFASDWERRGVLRQIMVWVKDSMVLGHSEYHYQHEPILFGWMPGERLKNTDRTRTSVWSYARPKASREHPTMKPIELWAQAIRNHTLQGDWVYDPFLGSGTTMIACEQLGRKCYGMEIEPKYVNVAVKRWEDYTGKKAKRAKGA